MIESSITAVLAWLALPTVGLPAVFLISFVSATLLPLGSEAAVFLAIKANPALFWATIGIATLGNTLGGVLNYALGRASHYTFREKLHKKNTEKSQAWLQRYGAKTLFFSWLPVVGDPLCALAGWQQLPFWPSVGYMAIGKLLRYLVLTWLLLGVPNGFWHSLII